MNKRLIVDSGVVVKWFVTEPDSNSALQIYDEYLQGGLELLAPSLIFAEVANIVWKKHVLQDLKAADAWDTLAALPKIDFEITPISYLVDDAFRIAVEHRRTVYDALYLALAERENRPFVTVDKRLVNAVSHAMPNVILLSDWVERNP